MATGAMTGYRTRFTADSTLPLHTISACRFVSVSVSPISRIVSSSRRYCPMLAASVECCESVCAPRSLPIGSGAAAPAVVGGAGLVSIGSTTVGTRWLDTAPLLPAVDPPDPDACCSPRCCSNIIEIASSNIEDVMRPAAAFEEVVG
uniref:Uncharacterized protein n=1 Tax=Anopheles coluzzii TaxID=1518534 RepID=A0A8W7PJX3_ANOCL